jgi:hypothetical protein
MDLGSSDEESLEGISGLMAAYRRGQTSVRAGYGARLRLVQSRATTRSSSPTRPDQQHQLYTVLLLILGSLVYDMQEFLDEVDKPSSTHPLYVAVVHMGRTRDLPGKRAALRRRQEQGAPRSGRGWARPRNSCVGSRAGVVTCSFVLRWRTCLSLLSTTLLVAKSFRINVIVASQRRLYYSVHHRLRSPTRPSV